MSLRVGMRAAILRMKPAPALGKHRDGRACQIATLEPCVVVQIAGDRAKVEFPDGQKRTVRCGQLVYASGARA